MPSRGRPDNVSRFISHYVSTKAVAPLVLLLDEDDPTLAGYQSLDLPETFLISISNKAKDGGIVALMNEQFNNNPDKDFYAVVCDDVIPHTDYWDKHLITTCVPDGLTWARDGIQNANLPTHPFIGGDLVREWGYIAPPVLKHFFADNFWRDEAHKRGCGLYREDIYLEHMHPIVKKAQLDATYRAKLDMSDDHKAYESFNNGND